METIIVVKILARWEFLTHLGEKSFEKISGTISLSSETSPVVGDG